MPEPPLPPNEPERLATLHALHLLDTPPEERIERITRTASRLFDAPIALVSLVDENRQWFKSCLGLSVRETPRGISFCAHAIAGGGILVIEDTLADPRFADNPLVVGSPHIRFYAGQPLRATNGHLLGTLCIGDQKPRRLSEVDRAALRDLAAWAERELNLAELDDALSRLAGEVAERRRAERRLQAQQAVSRVLAESGSLAEATPKILQAVGASLGWDMGVLWGVDPEADVLHCVEIWRAPSVSAPKLERTTRAATFRRGEGAPGEVWAGGELIWLDDRATQTRYPRARVADEEGLTIGFWFPIRHGDEVLGVLEFLSHETQEADDDLLHLLVATGHQIGGFIKRREAEEALHRAHAELEERVSERTQALELTNAALEAEIAERRLAESAVRQSNRTLGALIQASPLAIFTLDRDGNVELWNHAAETIFGYRESQAIGRYLPIVADDQRDEYRQLRQITLDGGRLDGAELIRHRKDGTPVEVSVWTAPLRDDRDEIAGIMVVMADDTERRAAQEALRRARDELELRVRERTAELAEANAALGDANAALRDEVVERKRAEGEIERQYRAAERARSETRAILDAAGEAMLLVAPDGRVLTVNRRFVEFFGLLAPDLLDRHLETFRPTIERIFDPEEFRRLTAASANSTGRFTRLLTQRWPEARELELFSTPVSGAGGVNLGRLYVFRDVTREREVDRMKTEFVSLVSHELRTPLTSIKGYVDLLMEGEVGEIASEQREFLQIVRNNADRLVALINDLLDVSRIESGKLELKRAALDLTQMIASVAGSLRPQIEARQQRLSLDLHDASAIPRVTGDEDRVTQILLNLLSNAHKYTPPGGEIVVSTRADGGFVRVDVRDSGIGMTPAELGQLFTKFFRADNRTAQEVGGTGLGLAITRSLVEMHGGTVEVASAPGAGSTFSFTLPALGSAAASGPPEAELEAAATGGRVLVVDDEPDIANLIRRYLERAGYSVVVAASAHEALALARRERPNLITLDLALPDADGFTLLEWLKSDAATALIPVVLLSILPDDGRGQLLGAVGYLSKPVEERVLLDRIRALLTGDRPRRILLADDDADVRTLLAGMLRRAGYRVVEASGGAEVITLARRQAPDLALIDVKMPDTDGIAALRALRAEASTRAIPVIMITASPGVIETSRAAVESLGLATLLAKPCSPEELAAAIATHLPRPPAGSPV